MQPISAMITPPHKPGERGAQAALLQVVVPLLLMAAAASAFGALIARFAADVPNADDFDMFVSFLVSFLDAHSFSERLGLIFQRHTEHIIATCRIAAILSHKILGVIDFRALIVAGNCAIPACIILLMRCWDYRGPARLAGVAAAGIALLQPQYLQTSLWASGAIQNLWVMVFVLGAFAVAQRARSELRGALAVTPFLAMAACTQANGIFAALLVAGIFLRKRQFGASVVAAVFFAGAVLYVQGHTSVHAAPGGVSLVDYARYVLAFLGAPLGTTFFAAQLWGAFTCTILVLLARDYTRSPALFAVCLFVILTAAANAVARIHFGVDYAYTQSRYTCVALFFLVALYLLALERLPQSLQPKVSMAALLLVAVGAGWSFCAHLPEAEMRRNVLEESAFLVSATGTGFEYPNQKRARRLYDIAVQKRLLRPLEAASPIAVQSLNVIASGAQGDNTCRDQQKGSVERVIASSKVALISGYILLPPGQADAVARMVEIIGASSAHGAPVVKRPRPDAAAHHNVPQERISGFLAVLDTQALTPGRYAVRIMGSDGACLRTGKLLEVTSEGGSAP